MAASWPWIFCCSAQEHDDHQGFKGGGLLPISLLRKETQEPEPEFFECAETFQELEYLKEVEKLDKIRRLRRSSSLASASTEAESEPSISSGRHSSKSTCSDVSSASEGVGTKDLAEAMALLESTRKRFLAAHPKEGTDCPEMEWANLGTARRFVKAVKVMTNEPIVVSSRLWSCGSRTVRSTAALPMRKTVTCESSATTDNRDL